MLYKISRILLPVLIFSICFACNKDDDNKEEQSVTSTINGEKFNPTKITITLNNGYLIITLIEGSKKVEIITNNSITGNYGITQEAFDGTSLLAQLTFMDSVTSYIGINGILELTDEGFGVYSGSFSASVISEELVTLEVNTIEFSDIELSTGIPIAETPEEFDLFLSSLYYDLARFFESAILFDAVYTNYSQAPDNEWVDIYNHAQTSYDEKIYSFWDDAWRLINKTNYILSAAEDFISNEEQLSVTLGQARASRAYVYYTLMIWFGELPLQLEPYAEQGSRHTLAEVMQVIIEDALAATYELPEEWPVPENYKLNKGFAQSLLADIYLMNGSYEHVRMTTSNLLTGSTYYLGDDPFDYTESNPEFIYGFTKSEGTEFGDFFTKGDYMPVVKLTKLVLADIESNYNLGNLSDAIYQMNRLIVRRYGDDASFQVTSINEEDIYQAWMDEMNGEGINFAILKRFNKAVDSLGIEDYKLLLPVPERAILINPELSQNPDY